MARRPSKHLRAPRPLDPARHTQKRTLRSGTYLVRSVPGARAKKTYRCPGCQQSIRPGVSHVVAWPEEPGWGSVSGLEERRHWHNHCWESHT